MKKLAWSLPVLLLAFSVGHADLEKERAGEVEQISPALAIRSVYDTFKANKEARAIALGKGKTVLGLYVFDRHGNCVARDDVGSPRTSDDLAVVWIPTETTRYDVEIRNAGYETNIYQITLR
jgi:hypothetical protein